MYAKLKKIKVFLTDVDGVMTTGHIFWCGEALGFNRIFNVKDGFGLRMLKKAGLKVGFISGDNSPATRNRASTLALDYVFIGNEDKSYALEQVLSDGYLPEQIAYIGDELFDITVLQRVGFSATVPEAPHQVKEVVDYITDVGGGMGCVREIIDHLCIAQNIDLNNLFYR